MIIADTDVLIDFLRGGSPSADRIAIELTSRSFATTAITAFELRSGSRTERQKRATDELLAAIPILPLTADDAAVAATIRLELESRGEGIGMADYLIAAICLSRPGILLTRNRKHFERVPGIILGSVGG